ncbi:MAG: right-handed parallel beta-helix repeat-containing protein [Sedimentisphaerales bacterium]|nr:right-handed parallel beta-helix repeat-containing protein [Sedimentisphaerales bacterium]
MCVCFLICGTCFADTLTVNHDGSGDYTAIGDALADAEFGDTIDIAFGVYSENIILPDGVKLIGQVIGSEPNDTIIDGTLMGTVIAVSGAGPTTLIQGLTIRNGSGTLVEEEPNPPTIIGGAILLNGSSPQISNCIIEGSSADMGGGLAGMNNSDPSIDGCSFRNNTANLYGGAIALYDSGPLIENCTIYSNTSSNDGGGVYAMTGSSPIFRNCIIEGNHAEDDGGGVYSFSYSQTTVEKCVFRANTSGDKAGAFYSDEYDESLLTGCLIIENEADNYGGAAYAFDHSDITFLNCRLLGNLCNNSGGGVRLYSDSSITAVNCEFHWNHVWGWGGAIECYGSSTADITNCTFLHNFAMVGGGIALRDDSSATINNSIFWDNNTSGNGDQLSAKSSELSIAFSVVEDGLAYIYNEDGLAVINYDEQSVLTDDPLVVDGNGPDDSFGTEDDNPRLQADSPCIDTGSDDAVPVGILTDPDGIIRIADGDCDGSLCVDIGAYEFNHADKGDFDGHCDTNLVDFTILAETWLGEPGDLRWNPACNIADSSEDTIDLLDLSLFIENWLWDGQLQE